MRKKFVEKSPILMAQAREEWADAKPVLIDKARAAVRRPFTKSAPGAAEAAA